MYFKHYGGPAHFFRSVRQHLDESFQGVGLVGRGPNNCLVRSSDLTPLDYYKVDVDTQDELT